MKKLLVIFAFILLNFYTLKHGFQVDALCDSTDCSNADDCQRKIEECGQIISAYSPAQNKNKQDLANLDKQLTTTRNLIKSAEAQQKKLEKSIFDREVDLGYQQAIFATRVRRYYIRSQLFSPFLIFLATDNATLLTREFSYRNTMAEEDKKVIFKLSVDLNNLQKDKNKLDQNKKLLAQTQATLDKQATFLRTEVGKVENFLGTISSKIAALSAKQQSLLVEKTGTFQTAVGEVPLADDPASRPDFNPGFSPAFAAFSFGAPHRKGMSQYGAWGRAKSGQSVEDILRAYYPGVEIKKDYSTSINITVRGFSSVNIETYVKRIYEMPSSWTDNDSAALKAQAVAARSYALAYTNNGSGSICATESCQVYKATNKGGAWDAAAEATRGWVLVSGGKPFSAWYAASSGGYNTPSGWDTKCGNQTCWTGDAYEKIAGSPWFYKGWYKNRQGSTCGRTHPWLNQEDMADILNAVLVYRSGSGAERILPIDYNSCTGNGGNPYSRDDLRREADGRGGAVTNVSGVAVLQGTNGQTNKLTFTTNKGNFEVGGEEFYTVFNLRAPGRIALKSKLFNLEKK